VTAGRRAEVTANGIATALLGGPWRRPGMVRRTAVALGYARAPRWVGTLAGEVLAAYPQAPSDRPGELALFVRTTEGWARGQAADVPPRVVRWQPRGTAVVRRPFPVAELPDLAALARLLDLDQGELAWFADLRGLQRAATGPLAHYRWRAVAHGGGVRLLAAPKPRLKEVQRRLLRHVLAPIPVHEAAHGCVPGRSVRTAAAPHAGADLVLSMDLEAFFTSIPAARVQGLLQWTAGLTEPVARAVTGLVTTVLPAPLWRRIPAPLERGPLDRHRRLRGLLSAPHLPQGAPTSPALANLVCFRLDRRLAALAAAFDATYTRYVDDLTFSGAAGLRARRLAERVRLIAADEGFRTNEAKTRTATAARRQAVVGVVVNERPTLPRPERDALRALLHNCTQGWAAQARGRDPATFRDHVLGRVAWAASVDPALGARLRAMADRIDWSSTGGN
jgi:RNA-directed DNA polymerase